MISRNRICRVLVFVLASALVWAQSSGKQGATKKSPPSTGGSATAPPAAAPAQGQYVGCYFERSFGAARILDGATFRSATMTNAACRTFCAEKGFTFAGTQAGIVCSCGNKAPTAQKLAETSCPVPCGGSKSEMCGGGSQSSIYKSK